MHRPIRPAALFAAIALGSATLLPVVAAANVMNFNPIKDNSMYAELPSNSNGIGDGIYSGNNQLGNTRRALLAFDLSSLPAGSAINSATLTLQLQQTNSGPQNVSLHRVTADWGEGISTGSGQGAAATPGDATWLRRFYDITSWTTAGGDYVGTASATTNVSGLGPHVWSGPGLTGDVIAWQASPATNFGWIVIGNEVGTFTAMKFDSREGFTPPVLSVDFTPPMPGAAPAGLGALGLALGALGALFLRRRLEARAA